MAAPAPTPISTFELLFTPQLPPGVPVPTTVAQIDENVVKAYFLTISNPNTKQYVFDIFFHCNVNPSPAIPSRTLASAVGFVDDGSTATPLTITASTPVDFVCSVTVAARGTVLVGIIPLFFNASGFAVPVIDCRGWAELTLPALFGKNRFFPVPQSNAPVSIIVTPEQRLTFLPGASAGKTSVESQSAFALPVVGGSAQISVPPQPGFVFFPPLAGANDEEMGVEEEQHVRQMLNQSSAGTFATLSALIGASPAIQSGKRKTEEVMKELGLL